MEFLQIADRIFSEQVQVDWRSFTYKGMKNQLEKLQEMTKCEIDKIDELVDGIEYGIIFIELY